MKEVTEWNGKPRWMRCWDTENGTKVTEFVLCILTEEEMNEADTDYPVRTLRGYFKHCAEIEEPKKRPCTREELIEMLKKQGLPMLSWNINDSIYLVNELFYSACNVSDVQYTYSELCKDFTLLDGTPLWVEE